MASGTLFRRAAYRAKLRSFFILAINRSQNNVRTRFFFKKFILQRDSGARYLVHGMSYASKVSIEPVRLAREGATTSQYERIASAGLVVARPTTLHPAERPD